MFSSASFSQASFSPTSFRFDQQAGVLQQPAGGHRLQLVRAFAGHAPELRVQRAATRYRVLQPQTVPAMRAAVETLSLYGVAASAFRVSPPTCGTLAAKVIRSVATRSNVRAPHGACSAPMRRGLSWSMHDAVPPVCGATAAEVRGYSCSSGVVAEPWGIHNPTPEQLLAIM